MGDVDVVSDILSAAMRAYPDSDFVQSLSHQYLVRGSLSKRQLEGLYKKAERINELPHNKLATLEALILKRPKKYKSVLPPLEPLYKKDEAVGKMLDDILQKYPQHKRVVYFLSKYQSNEPFSTTERTELEKFHKLLVK
ncbi:MAG TPA: hypothetical protein VM888_09375 [Chitinophagaceae bacterium]|jgi:hypothetical protein|nr:hypothetical protein [Chitinophagaceae bacterium]